MFQYITGTAIFSFDKRSRLTSTKTVFSMTKGLKPKTGADNHTFGGSFEHLELPGTHYYHVVLYASTLR